MTAEEITAARLRLLENGYPPVPVVGKRPVGEGWDDPAKITPATIAALPERYPHATNTGILTAYTPAFDNDIRHPEAAEAAEERLRNRFGDGGTWICRIGMPPKRVNLLRTATPFKKIRRELVAPGDDVDAPGYKPHAIEVLCDGQQVVMLGVHEDTRREYACTGGIGPLNTPRTDLPEVTEAEAREAVDDLVTMYVNEYGFRPYERPTATNGSADGHHGEPVDVEAELAAMAPGGVNACQARVIPSLLRQGIHPDEILERGKWRSGSRPIGCARSRSSASPPAS